MSYDLQGEIQMSYIEFNHITKEYKTGEVSIKALDDASFYVEKGELAVILGSSGAGKTTALNVLGGMDTPTSGEIIVDGNVITSYNKKKITEYRREDIGFVFQFYNLVPNLTAEENVELAAQVCKDSLDAGETLEKVGLKDRKGNFPAQLSGGEQQRVAIARAIAKNPKLLLCDEPTGALDYNTGKQILQLLQDTCRKDNITVLIITHNSALAPMADRLIRFKSGKVIEMTTNDNPISISEIEW
jgi:putative ABC transport system ATP-binding protein